MRPTNFCNTLKFIFLLGVFLYFLLFSIHVQSSIVFIWLNISLHIYFKVTFTYIYVEKTTIDLVAEGKGKKPLHID